MDREHTEVRVTQEHSTDDVTFRIRATRGRDIKTGEWSGEGKIGRKLWEVNTRAVIRRQDQLIGEFKMTADNVIRIRGRVMGYTYIPTGITREL